MKTQEWNKLMSLIVALGFFLFAGVVSAGPNIADSTIQESQTFAHAPLNGVVGAPALGLMRVSNQQALQAANRTLLAADPSQAALQVAAAIVNQNTAASALAGGSGALFSVAEKRTATDAAGNTHVRIKQYYQGIPVVGAELIVHMRDGVIYRTTGKYLPFADVSTTPGIDLDTAVQAGLTAAVKDASGASLKNGADLVIFNNRLAYHYELEQEGDAWGIWKYYVDAHTGQILLRYNNIQHAAPVEGSGFHTNVTGNLLSGEGGGSPTIEGFFENAGSLNFFLYNFNNLWGIYDLSLTIPDWAQQASSNWGSSDPAAFSLANNMAITQAYVADAVDGLGMNSFDGAGAFAQANVHQPSPSGGFDYVNAFWDGTDFHFGDGDGVLANPLTVMDIVAHEYGHAITTYSSTLLYWMQSGALNEAYSDILGALVEFSSQPMAADPFTNPGAGQADWLMGEDCWLSGIATRSIADPLALGDPSYYKGTDWWFGIGDNGGVHTNSGVLNKAFYLLAVGGSGTNDGHAYNLTGLGIEDAGSIAMQANRFYHTTSDTYFDARAAWKDAADDLGFSTAAVDAVFNAVGVPSFMHAQTLATSVEDVPSQDFPDLSGAIYAADDFTLSESQTINTIGIHGMVSNGGTTLLNASALSFYIYTDGGGMPSGNPSEATDTSFWSISLAVTDSQLTITETPVDSTGDGFANFYHAHVNLNLSSPQTLPAGTYWLLFVPTMAFNPNGQNFWPMSDATSGNDAQVMDPDSLLSWPTTWTSVTSVGRTRTALAFEIESTEPVVPNFQVDFESGPNGSLTGSTTQIVDLGDDCTAVTAVPDAGYMFDGWTGDYTGTDNPLTVTNVTSAMTITANFVPLPQYTVTFTAGANGSLSGITSQVVMHGANCTAVTAVPDAGYVFSQWTGDYSGSQNPLMLTNVTSNMAVTATFTVAGSGGGGGGGGCFIDAASFSW